MNNSYLDENGLSYYDKKIKQYIDEHAGVLSASGRIKENIKESEIDCEKLVDELPIYEFNFADDSGKVTQIGIMGQDLEEALSEKYRNGIITSDGSMIYGARESKLIFILWDALKKEREKTKEMEKRIEDLEGLVKTL